MTDWRLRPTATEVWFWTLPCWFPFPQHRPHYPHIQGTQRVHRPQLHKEPIDKVSRGCFVGDLGAGTCSLWVGVGWSHFLGWGYPDESSRLIPWFPHLSPPLDSSITQPWSRDRLCPSLPCLSPAARSVGAWHGATSPKQEGRRRVSPSGCQLSQLTQLDTSLPPPGTQPPNSPVFRLVWWFSVGSTPFLPPRAPGLQPGAASSGTRAPCPLAWRALSQDDSNLLQWRVQNMGQGALRKAQGRITWPGGGWLSGRGRGAGWNLLAHGAWRRRASCLHLAACQGRKKKETEGRIKWPPVTRLGWSPNPPQSRLSPSRSWSHSRVKLPLWL